MSYDAIFGEIASEKLADLLPIYYSLQRMISNLEKIIDCIDSVEKIADKCIGNNVRLCIIETLSTLDECYNDNMKEFSTGFSNLVVSGIFTILRWLGGLRGYELWQEDLVRLLYPFIGMAEGILRFLISNARLIAEVQYGKESLRREDIETISIYKPSIDTLLVSKGYNITKDADYFQSGPFKALLEEAKVYLNEARDVLSDTARVLREDLDRFIAWNLRKRNP